MIEDALVSILNGDTAVAAIVGDRVYPLTKPQQGTLPAIVYQRVSTIDSWTLQGVAGPSAARVQLSLMAVGFTQVRALAAAVKAALNAFSGEVAGYVVNLIQVINILDDFKPDTGICRVLIDVRVFSNEGA